MRSASWHARAFFISLALFILVLVLFISSGSAKGPISGLSTMALPITFFLVLYFLVRWIGANRTERKPVPTAGSVAGVNPIQDRTWRTSEAAHAASTREKIGGMANDDLLTSLHHPDTASDVRHAVAGELATRGVAGEGVEEWMPPAEHLSVQSALPAGRTATGYLSAMRVRTVFMDLGRLLIVAGIIYVVVIWGLNKLQVRLTIPIPFLQLSVLLALAAHDWNRRTFGVAVAACCAGHYLLALVGIRLPLPLPFGAATLLVAGFACLFLAPLVSRGERARILLLRPFGPAPMSAALKRVVRRHLGLLGSVFTLSDRNYSPSLTLDLLKIAGQFRHLAAPLLRPSLRIASVWNEGSYRGLARTMSSNLALDFQSAYSGGQAFNIASANNWWQYCIDLLMHSTDFVVMDVSRVREGSAWEIIRLVRREAMDRTIFIAHEAYQADALQGFEGLLPPRAMPKLHLFRESGEFIDLPAFEAAVESMLTNALTAASNGSTWPEANK